jgi:hypothetical protein
MGYDLGTIPRHALLADQQVEHYYVIKKERALKPVILIMA